MAKNQKKNNKTKQVTQQKPKEMSKKERDEIANFASKALGDLLPALNAKIRENKQKQQPQEPPARDLGIRTPIDYAHPVRTWSKYGYTEFAQLKTNHQGAYVGPSGYKVVIKQIPTKNPFLRVQMPRGQPFVPEEAIEEILATLQQRIRDTYPEHKDIVIDTPIKKHSHGGDIQHWIVGTNVFEKIKGSYAGEKDNVKLGFSIRNGYNTDVSLGIDIFTFRGICSNGAIFKSTDLSKTSIRHVGNDPKKLVEAFHEGLMFAISDWKAVIELYNKMAETRLTKEIAQFIYEQNSKMPLKYFPKYYNIPTKEEIKKAAEKKKPAPVVTITNEGRTVTLWENFNDMTRKLTRAEDPTLNDESDEEDPAKLEKLQNAKPISFYELAWQETRLHRAFKGVFEDPERFV